jgi:hypothetical protein
MSNNDKERAIVRELARKVSEIAAEPRMSLIMKRWRDVNSLRKPDRAPVWCKPVGCWEEIIPGGSFLCQTPWLRSMESNFRKIICKREIDDDSPVEKYFPMYASQRIEPANVWGLDITHHQSGESGGAWAYDPPLKSAEDYSLLKTPKFTYDKSATDMEYERLSGILDGIMPVKVEFGLPLSATLGTFAADLRGLEQMMMDMVAEPELMHRLMTHLRDAALKAIENAESKVMISPNNYGPMLCSDPIGKPDDGKLSCANLWCMANSQEFDQVSPQMREEFCLNYQKPIFKRFGQVCYGCCENLTHKIDGVLSIPNLRIFTCSAWTDLSIVMDKVGRKHCIMWRQKASDVVFPNDTQNVKRALFDGAKQLQGAYYQIVLRELETLAGHQQGSRMKTRP